MFRFAPVVLILQAYCIYHIWTNRSDQKWIWLIIFLPLIGSFIYLYQHFYNRENIAKVSEGLKGAVNTNYEVERLEQALNFSDSTVNSTRLADKYVEVGRLQEGIDLYLSCLVGFDADDPDILASLLHAYYKNKNYSEAAAIGEKISNHSDFADSLYKVSYAWSLFRAGNKEKALAIFQEMDSRYSNYNQRIEFVRFLKETEQTIAATEKLDELKNEYEQMDGYEKKLKRSLRGDLYRLGEELKK